MNRAALASTPDPSEGHPIFYLVRLVSFLLILWAILGKDLSRRQPGPEARDLKGRGAKT